MRNDDRMMESLLSEAVDLHIEAGKLEGLARHLSGGMLDGSYIFDDLDHARQYRGLERDLEGIRSRMAMIAKTLRGSGFPTGVWIRRRGHLVRLGEGTLEVRPDQREAAPEGAAQDGRP